MVPLPSVDCNNILHLCQYRDDSRVKRSDNSEIMPLLDRIRDLNSQTSNIGLFGDNVARDNINELDNSSSCKANMNYCYSNDDMESIGT